ncbi:MAG TPA: archease [Chloroflexi bacterium]|nr:archease [Chloroflexota bacterium]
MKEKRFEEIEHTADLSIRVWGGNLAELFANAAYGLAHQLAVDPDSIPAAVERQVELEAYDLETLLVDWLDELLYLGEQDALVFTAFDVAEITDHRLRATVRGGPPVEHRSAVKATTFHELEIVQTDEGYETTIVFDV